MFHLFQIQLSDEQVDEVNNAGGWNGVDWGNIYMDLTIGRFSQDDVSAEKLIQDAIEAELIKHTMSAKTNDLEEAFLIGHASVKKLNNILRPVSVAGCL